MERPLRRFALAILALALFGLLATACGGDGGASPTPTRTPVQSTPTPEAPELSAFRNFVYPIQGGCLPESERLMPNAPRDYRSGIHEGVDFYGSDNCVGIDAGTEVVAVRDGRVIRADVDYHDLTQVELGEVNQRIADGHPNDFEVIDLLRGRQVWIDHRDGIVTRYAHLGGIAEGIVEGVDVAQGQTIAYVGNSGTPESLGDPASEMHLHFEVRIGDTYLGKDLPPDEVRDIYESLFTPWP